MRKHIIAGLVLIAFFGLAQASRAAPVSIQLTLTGASGANLFISLVEGAVTAATPFDVSGTIDVSFSNAIDDSLSGLVTTDISLDDADIQLSDESLHVGDVGFLGSIDFAINGAGINTLDSNGNIPVSISNPTDPFEYTFDPGGGSPTAMSIGQGLFTYDTSGPPLETIFGSGIIDFSVDPIGGTLGPIGQLGLVTQDVYFVGSQGFVDVVVSIPWAFSDTLLSDVAEIDVEFSGVIVATGTYPIVPEPSTFVLLSIAIVALIPLRRRIMNCPS